jgi:hypothetical protein
LVVTKELLPLRFLQRAWGRKMESPVVHYDLLMKGKAMPPAGMGNAGVRPSSEIAASYASIRPVAETSVTLGAKPLGGRALIEKLPPVAAQFDRGTCGAFAFTVLNEHVQLRKGDAVRLSQQHLYYECKEIDGIASCEGTTLEAASRVLAEIGQCTALFCPYVTGSCNNDLGSISVTAARQQAAAYKVNTIPINPKDIDGLERILDAGWPVVVHLDTFTGWDDSRFWQTGELLMPTSNREDVTHIVCIIGYTDNPANAGPRGYYLFRNSWGAEFGANCTFLNQSFAGAGDGIIPIEYLERFCLGAYTVAEAVR